MINKFKIYIILFFSFIFTAISFSQITYANNIIAFQSTYESETVPQSSKIVWKYKVINGVLYKRKYNTTKKEWIGGWIKA